MIFVFPISRVRVRVRRTLPVFSWVSFAGTNSTYGPPYEFLRSHYRLLKKSDFLLTKPMRPIVKIKAHELPNIVEDTLV